VKRRRGRCELKSDGLQIGGGGLAAALIGFHVIRELLALVEVAHAGALDRRDVNEHIRAAAVLHDEAEAFLRIEELDSTCGQSGLLLKTRDARLCPRRTIRLGLISGFLRVLGKRPFRDQTTRSGSIANEAYMGVRGGVCNRPQCRSNRVRDT